MTVRTSRRRCVCRHGYGTHRLDDANDTVVPAECRSPGCPCVRYTRETR